MWPDWLVSCDCSFQSVCPLREKGRRLMEASWWERLWGKLGPVLMAGALFSKSLIQFSVDGWGSVPSLLFTWGQTMVEVMKIMVTSFKRSYACTATPISPSPAAGHHQPAPLLETPGHLWASLGQSLAGSLLLSPGSWCTRFCLCPPRVCFPVLGKFWQLCGGVNGDLLQEGLCHTQVCCTQSPCPCGRPLLIHTPTGDTQIQFHLSFCGVSGSCYTQGLFQPSEHFRQAWGLILNVILPFLPSC